VANGGTGQIGWNTGGLVLASATNVLAQLADVATGNVLISGGVGIVPSYGKVGLTTHVSGVLPVANGGTSFSSYAVGDILFASTTTVLSKLADVATGNVLISGGVGVAPSYGKVDLTVHITGTLGVGNGGTGQTTYSNGQVLIGNAGSLTKATLTAGQGISVTNGAGSITITAATEFYLLRETYTSTNIPGNSVAGSSNRILNTVYHDPGTGNVVLNPVTGGFLMAVGTYYIEASVPCVGCDVHMILLYDVTAGGDFAYGTLEYSSAGAPAAQTRSWLKYYLTVSTSSVFQLRHITKTASTNGLGIPETSWAYARTYAEAYIVKLS
jgi:hypothetical protein